MRAILCMSGIGLALALGCAGALGYGQEVGSAVVQPGTPFAITYTPLNNEPHQLWLDYAVSYLGPDFEVKGPITLTVNSQPVGAWNMKLTNGAAPVAGGGRIVLNELNTTQNGQFYNQATIFIATLPAQPVGATVDVSGTFTVGSHTTPQALRLVVTD